MTYMTESLAVSTSTPVSVTGHEEEAVGNNRAYVLFENFMKEILKKPAKVMALAAHVVRVANMENEKTPLVKLVELSSWMKSRGLIDFSLNTENVEKERLVALTQEITAGVKKVVEQKLQIFFDK